MSRINRKADRFIKTPVSEWDYGISFKSSAKRNRWLGLYLGIYDRRSCHMGFVGRAPFQQLALL